MALPRIMERNDLLKFRTRVCQRWMKGNKCNFGDKCQYSHDLIWPRRPLWEVQYSENLCTFTSDDGEKCPFARNCPNSHTEVEALYHPNVYKSKLCREFNRTGKCGRYYCPYAHGTAELRAKQQTNHQTDSTATAVDEQLSPLSDSTAAEPNSSPLRKQAEDSQVVHKHPPLDEISSFPPMDTRGVVYVHRATLQYQNLESPDGGEGAGFGASTLSSLIPTLIHPNCSPMVLTHLYEMFDEQPSGGSAGLPSTSFPLMDAWQVILAVNRVLYVAETNRNVTMEIWKQYLGTSLLAFVAPERVAYWNHVMHFGHQDAPPSPDDLKALTWSAFLMLYISQYGIHPFAPNGTCVLYMLREGRPDAALSERCMEQVMEAFAENASIERCAPQLVRGLEMRPSLRGTWNQILTSYSNQFSQIAAPLSPLTTNSTTATAAAAAAAESPWQKGVPLYSERSITRTSTGEESDFPPPF